MLTNEDLMKISGLFDVKFEAQNRMIDDKLHQQKKELQEEIRVSKYELRKEIQDFREELKGDIQTFREELKGDIQTFREELKGDIQRVENKTDNINIILENDIRPRLSNIESCYVDTFERYRQGVVEMGSIKTDVEILKKVANEHSEKLKKIQ